MSRDMNRSKDFDAAFDFLYKTSRTYNTCQDSATKIFESFVNQKLNDK